VKGQKNDYNDAEAIAEAALRPNLRFVQEKSQDQLDLQACHRVRSRLVSRRTATINQIRAFLIEQGIAVRTGPRALRNSLFAILENRKDEISARTARLIRGLYEDWCYLDERIETVTGEIEALSRTEAKCRQLMSIPGVGPLISTAMVAAIGSGEAFVLTCELQPVHTCRFSQGTFAGTRGNGRDAPKGDQGRTWHAGAAGGVTPF
jgi:transposase